ncbi:MAG TPA: allophanate hydrolase [Rubrivivax sp.]
MPASPLTLDDWRAAAPRANGVGDWEALRAAHARIALAGTPVYLHVASRAQLDVQLATLEARAVAPGAADSMPLFGVPFVVKDNIDIAGAPTTAACPAYAYTAGQTASAVQRLMDAGAVWLAKTNLDQFATGLVGTRSPYGAPASTWSAAHVSGGSSSGSAVAVARGDVPLALGTDTAGSGRIPAGFNHIVGLKPTPGRVSTAGVLPACRSIDCVSVFALTVDDAARALAVMEGADAADLYSRFEPGPAFLSQQAPQRLRLGVPDRLPPDTDPAFAAAFEQACAQARQLGHDVVALDFAPLHDVAALLYAGPWVAERYAVIGTLLQSRPEAVDSAVREVVSQATAFSAADAFAGQYKLRALAAQAAQTWARCDALLVPTAPGHPTLAQLAADPIGANARLGIYTNFVNLLGWCALALPASVTPEGLPFGVTFIAPGGHDAALARFGRSWQAQAGQTLGATGQRREALDTAPSCWPASEATWPIAVVGAHLSGLPLNGQLLERGARLRERCTTSTQYRLYALPGTTPPKPGMLRVPGAGQTIELEIWDMPLARLGSFLALVPSPLGLGSIELADGRHVHGFLCEPFALEGARDISSFGGWRAYIASL